MKNKLEILRTINNNKLLSKEQLKMIFGGQEVTQPRDAASGLATGKG
jgi:hypothetical protein